MKAHLFNERGYLEALFITSNRTNDKEIVGEIQVCTHWDLDGNPIEKVFFSKVRINWTGESEFYFPGQHYMQAIKDCRYYFNGIDDYIMGMKLLNFAYQVMIEYFGGEEKVFETDDIPKLKKLNLLKNHTIKYS